jgi:hypothetical protein
MHPVTQHHIYGSWWATLIRQQVARIPSLPLPATTALFPPELVQVDANCTILPSHSICHPLLSAVRHLPSAICRPLSHLALQPALGSIHKQCP